MTPATETKERELLEKKSRPILEAMASELLYTEGQKHGPIARCKQFVKNKLAPLECVEILSKA